ncbi:hypothetical protein [Paenarthrobacter nicotinovorans]|uniref:hypothetical protein n=1 Tax=Paenarthrobacter nicotinovorans TaxID=29320 RepID=UPI0012E8ADB9|nr:hypothetical protein [Paenarthrobacter nicotinovorans]
MARPKTPKKTLHSMPMPSSRQDNPVADETIMLVQDRGELAPGDKVLLRYPSGIQCIETIDDLTPSGDVIWTISHYFHERKMVLETDPVEIWIYPKDFRVSIAEAIDVLGDTPLPTPIQRLGKPSQSFLPVVSSAASFRATSWEVTNSETPGAPTRVSV